MNVDMEYCDPFDGTQENIWMKVEHCGRYLFAADYIRENCVAGGQILDAACADGYGTEMLCGHGLTVTGADRSEEYLALARKRKCPAKFIQLDFDEKEMPFPKGGLHAVVCFETIEHVSYPEKLLGEFARILRPEGIMLLSFPNNLYEKLDENGNNKDPYHKHIFRPDDIFRMLGTSFEILDVLGQFLCNQAYALESAAVKSGALKPAEVATLYRYDPTSIRFMARALAYPCCLHIDDTYSYLIIARKK